VNHLCAWFLANYEDPAENTPCDGGQYVYIWGEPVDAIEELAGEFMHLFAEELLNEAADKLNGEYDCFGWVPKPVYEPEEP
jgi:hypothetical protein